MVLDANKGLFQRWVEIEQAAGKPFKLTLDEINAECGTAYRHNWPTKMADSGYSMERIPTAVRRYMMRKVLAAELSGRGVVFAPEVIDAMVRRLT